MKRNVALLFVLAFAFLAVTFWRGTGSSDTESAQPDGGASAPPAAPNEAPAAPQEAEEERSEAPAEPMVEVAAESAARKTAEERVTLRGAFRLRQRDGRNETCARVRSTLLGFSSEGAQLLRGAVYAKQGRWEFELRAREARSHRKLHRRVPAGGKPGVLPLVKPGIERIVANDGKGFDAIVRDPEPCTLRVFDAATKLELSNIEICKDCAGMQHEEVHERFVLARDLASPIDSLALHSPDERTISLDARDRGARAGLRVAGGRTRPQAGRRTPCRALSRRRRRVPLHGRARAELGLIVDLGTGSRGRQ